MIAARMSTSNGSADAGAVSPIWGVQGCGDSECGVWNSVFKPSAISDLGQV